MKNLLAMIFGIYRGGKLRVIVKQNHLPEVMEESCCHGLGGVICIRSRIHPGELLRDITRGHAVRENRQKRRHRLAVDRKSTRLNSSHVASSYAVFCSKKKIRWTIY